MHLTKTRKTMKKFIAAVLSASVLCACDKEGPESMYIDEDVYSVSHDMIVLGSKLEDPYSVEVIQEALLSLYPTKAGRVDVTPTNIYVRFLPSDADQFDLLEDLGVEMFDHPLDYQIIRDGDFYHDPSIPESEITWQYAVLKPDFNFPEGIRYEILEHCYIPSDAVTRADGIDWSEVEREAFRISGNEELLAESSTKAGKGFKPQGQIMIIDDDYNDGEPIGVAGIMVEANSFVKVAVGYTDSEGKYSLPRSFSSNIRYRLIFKNKKGFGIGMNLMLIPASMSALGKGSPEGLDVTIDIASERKLFTRCTVNNAAYDYYARCLDTDMPVAAPPQDLRIWIMQHSNASSTPMIQQGAVMDTRLVSEVLKEYKQVVQMFAPDMTLGVKDMEDYASIYLMATHELAHASHYVQVGNAYWDKYIQYVMTSFVKHGGNMYGSRDTAGSGYCEIGEMWAYYLEDRVSRDRYGKAASSTWNQYWFSPQILTSLDERGLNRSKIFDSLRRDVADLMSLREKLMELYPDDRYMIEQVFDRYTDMTSTEQEEI